MNKKILALIFAFALLLSALASCASDTPSPASTTTTTEQTAGTVEADVIVEIADAPDVPSGDYIVGRQIYRLNKAEKSLKILDFGMDYNKYKEDDGQTVAELPVRFVNYANLFEGVSFTLDGSAVYVYLSGQKFVLSKSDGSGFASTTMISPFPTDLVMPASGRYASQILEQYKVDASGNRIEAEGGGYERESFVLVLDIDADRITLSHGVPAPAYDPARPEMQNVQNLGTLLTANGYSLSYNAGGIAIRLPHENGEYSLSLSVINSESISFNNSCERYGDYSGAGTFRLCS